MMTKPTPKQLAEHTTHTNKTTQNTLTGILNLKTLVILLLPQTITFTDTKLNTTKTNLLIKLTMLMLLATNVVQQP